MTKISDVVEMTFGFAFKSSEFSGHVSDIRLLRGDNVGQGRLRWDGAVRFPSGRLDEVSKYTLGLGDVVIAMDRPWISAGLKYSIVREQDLPSLLVQRVARLRTKTESLDQGFLAALIGSRSFTNYVIGVQTGSAVPHISGKQIGDFDFELPPIGEQREIAATLGALDDKIESNLRERSLLRRLGTAEFDKVLERSRKSVLLESVALSIARGVTPKYADDDPEAPVVINQKCIRDGWVSLEPARRMHDREVKPAKRAGSGDVLVNSTGTGTLGRVARWHAGEVFVDSHVTVVKANQDEVDPAILAYSLLGRQADIEDLATGSTGQTELSPARLGSLTIDLPTGDTDDLASALNAIESRADQLATEIDRLKKLRDALLPELLSGRMRVPLEGAVA